MESRPPVTLFGLRLRYWLLTFGISGAILAVRLGVRTPGIFEGDVGAVGAYITAIGTLYGILTAFIIFVVWTQFNDAQTAADSETNELLDLFRYAIYLNDPRVLQALRSTIGDYSVSVVRDEWPAMSSGMPSPKVVEKFEAVFRAVHGVRFDDVRDATAWQKMIDKFEAVSDARAKRLELAVASVPRLLRGLLYLVSFALIGGFFVLSITNDTVAIVVTVATTAIALLAIEVVEDLDDPFGGQWALSPASFVRLPGQIDALGDAN
jgi:hypothetical protein